VGVLYLRRVGDRLAARWTEERPEKERIEKEGVKWQQSSPGKNSSKKKKD
jgi:hypothetical protein